MRFDWPPIWQGSPLQLVSQVQETNWPRHRQDANAETFGKKDKERIQRGMQALSFQQEEEQVSLNVVASADETTRMSTKKERPQNGCLASQWQTFAASLFAPGSIDPFITTFISQYEAQGCWLLPTSTGSPPCCKVCSIGVICFLSFLKY